MPDTFAHSNSLVRDCLGKNTIQSENGHFRQKRWEYAVCIRVVYVKLFNFLQLPEVVQTVEISGLIEVN